MCAGITGVVLAGAPPPPNNPFAEPHNTHVRQAAHLYVPHVCCVRQIQRPAHHDAHRQVTAVAPRREARVVPAQRVPTDHHCIAGCSALKHDRAASGAANPG
jgi:hypothetical protein